MEPLSVSVDGPRRQARRCSRAQAGVSWRIKPATCGAESGSRRCDIASGGELNGARSDRLRAAGELGSRQSLPRALPSELREPGFLPSATAHCVLD